MPRTRKLTNEQSRRNFLVKARRKCADTGFHRFNITGTMTAKIVEDFFAKCDELSIRVEGKTVKLAINR